MDELNLFGGGSGQRRGMCNTLMMLALLGNRNKGRSGGDDTTKLLLYSMMLPRDVFMLYLLTRRDKDSSPATHHTLERSGEYANRTSAEIAQRQEDAKAKRTSRQKAASTE